MNDNAIDYVALIPALIAGMLALACLVTYIIGSRGKWNKSLLGVAFAGLIIAVLPIFGIIFGRRLAGAYPGFGWVAVAGYALVAVVYAVLLIVIIIEQRKGSMPTPPIGKEPTE